MPVRHASALDIVALVNRLMTEAPARRRRGRRMRTQRVTLVADPRSNSVLVRADNPARAARVRQLIEQLDTPGRPGGNMFIVYLKNAEAARVAQTLRALLTAAAMPARRPASGVARTRRRRVPIGDGAAGAAPAPTAADGAAAARDAPPARRDAFIASGVTIQADTANNALIIMAPEPSTTTCARSSRSSTCAARRCYVEALIVEVSADKAAEFGIQWQALQRAQHDADARDRRHQLRRARQRQQHHRRRGQSAAPSARASTSA